LKQQYPEKRQWEDLDYNTQSKWPEAAADSYTAMERMACSNSRWKAANQSKD
jgi:hypothetical protein